MKRFATAAATSHNLSLAAMEEASRWGQRTADIDHLLLALTVNEQIAGDVLRSLGVNLAVTRAAVQAQHAEQLASLGIVEPSTTPEKITFDQTGGYQWSARALTIIKRSNQKEKHGDAADVLRELLAEPSGFIDAVLHRLNTSSETVLARLDEAGRQVVKPKLVIDRDRFYGITEQFVPAPIKQVWELLADPSRMPEWLLGTGSVENLPPVPSVGSTWVSRAVLERPDGKPIRIKAEFQASQVELVALDESDCLEWQFTWSDAPNANARNVRIELFSVTDGTRLRISLAWVRRAARNRVWRSWISWPLRPIRRFFLWLQLARIGSGISRVFR